METDAQINQGLDARTNATEYLSIHSAFSATGANELSGGSYARTQIEWDAASGRVADNTNQETVQIPAGSTVRWLGRWSAASSGTFYGMVNGRRPPRLRSGLTRTRSTVPLTVSRTATRSRSPVWITLSRPA